MAEQGHVTRLIGNPLRRLWEIEPALRIAVMAERAVQGNEAIADQTVGQQAALGGRRRRYGEAGDAFRQRHALPTVRLAVKTVVAVPVLIEHATEAQVGDPGAAQLAEPGKRRGEGRAAEQDVDDVASALQRRAVVWRAEKDDVPQPLRPTQPVRSGVMHRTADEQAAHAVRQHADLFDWHRPMLEQLLQLQRQFASILRDVQAGVVAQANRRHPKLGRQRLSMVDRLPVVLRIPLQIVAAQAMNH